MYNEISLYLPSPASVIFATVANDSDPSTYPINIPQATVQYLIANGIAATSFYSLSAKFAATVALSSEEDVSAIQFTVTGLDLYNNPIRETLNGPPGGDAVVYTTTLFYSITAFVATDPFSDITLANGQNQLSQWFSLDRNSKQSQIAVSVQVSDDDSNAFVVYQTFDPLFSYDQYSQLQVAGYGSNPQPTTFVLGSGTGSTNEYINYSINALQVASVNTGSDPLIFTVLQQGI